MNEKIDESWADFWKNRVLMQYECPAADFSTPQDRRRRMLDSRDAVWYEGWYDGPLLCGFNVAIKGLSKWGALCVGAILLFVCLFVCLSIRSFVCLLWNMLSHWLRGSTWRQAGAFRIVFDTLVYIGWKNSGFQVSGRWRRHFWHVVDVVKSSFRCWVEAFFRSI